MNIFKAMPLLLLALFIDGLQGFISLALSLVAAFPGTVGGCAAGGAVAGTAGCVVLGVLGSVPIVNGALATITEPVGILLGIAISICISFTLGSMLVFFLQLIDMLDKKAAIMAYMGEVMPGFDMLPSWTALVVYCMYKEGKKKLVGSASGVVAGFGKTLILSDTQVRKAMRQQSAADVQRLSEIDYAEMQAIAGEGLDLDTGEDRTGRVGGVPMQDIRSRRARPAQTETPPQARTASNLEDEPRFSTPYAQAV